MAFISYPFTSNVTYDSEDRPIYDRPMSAENLRKLYIKDRSNGVVLMGDSGALQVKATSTPSRNVTVAAGYCFINGVTSYNDAAITIAVPAATPTNPRIDAVVLRLDLRPNYRNVSVQLKQGTPAATPTAPTLTRNSDQWELRLANIAIPKASTVVEQQRITDFRLNTAHCGESVPLQPIDTTRYFDQIQDQVTKNLTLIQSAIDKTTAGQLQTQINTNKTNIASHTSSINQINNKISSSATANNKLISKSEALLLSHPVGSWYISDVATSPAQLFGGKWEKIKDGYYPRVNTAAERQAGSATQYVGTNQHKHGTATAKNNTLKAATGAIFGNPEQFAWEQVGVSYAGAKGTYHIKGAAAGGSVNMSHFTPIYGATVAENHEPKARATYMWKRTA